MGILSVLGRKQEVVVEEPVEEELPQEFPHYGPYLAVLEPDVAGISSFRLQFFSRAGQAEDLIATLRPDVRRGTHAFWAMHERPTPSEDLHIEALVLIRAQEDSDVVYVVSFLDLESANSFTRFEVKRGLSLGNVLIYWAAFTQLREELEAVSVLPAEAPLPLTGTLAPAGPPPPVVTQAEAAVDTYLERAEETPAPVREIPAASPDVPIAPETPPVVMATTATPEAPVAPTPETIAAPPIESPGPSVVEPEVVTPPTVPDFEDEDDLGSIVPELAGP
jgi:hypothetical protein